MIRTLAHTTFGGGYTMRRKTIIDAAEIFGDIEIMAMYSDGHEIESKIVFSEDEAMRIFDDMVLRYAEPLQRAFYKKLSPGRRYTLVYLNDFGFPVAEKIEFLSVENCTYAQYSDSVIMTYKPYRKRNNKQKRFYNQSVMIFEGWQGLQDEDVKNISSETDKLTISFSKYGCFDNRYIEDLEKVFKDPVVIYKDYKSGVNGKNYA